MLVILISIGLATHGRAPNLFSVLDVGRGASRAEIKVAYKRMTLLYHPDKYKGPDAAENSERFMHITKAYDNLLNDDYRRTYDRFGAAFADNEHHDSWLKSPSTMAFIYFQFYGVAILVTFLHTTNVERQAGRLWSFLLLAVIFVLEIYIKHDDKDNDFTYSTSFFPHISVHQKFEMLQLSFFNLSQLLCFFSDITYQNEPEKRHLEQMALLNVILDVIDNEPGSTNEGAAGESKTSKPVGGMKMKLKALEYKKRMAEIQQPPPQKQGVSWVNMILIGIFVYNAIWGKG